jgi:hypothetical protein
MADDWRVTEALKQLRQMVTCPLCGALVSTADGYSTHQQWHEAMNQYVASVDARLAQFSDYIINPETGLQKQIQDRLDTITNYVVAPQTGLEPRVTAAITSTNGAVAQLRTDATNAINQLRTDATNAINGLDARVDVLEAA